VFSAQIFQENTFLETKPNFPLTGKCFPLTNIPIGKQTQENLESDFLETKLNFPLTGKCFPLTNIPNGKQTQESLESDFPESEFRET